MKITQASKWIYQSVYYLASGLTYLAILLRSILIYRGTPYQGEVVGILVGFLLLFLVVNLLSKDIGAWFHVYLGMQTILVSFLIFNPNHTQYDYFTVLFGILGMQAMQNLSFRSGLIWIGGFFFLIGYRFISAQGIIRGLLNVLLFGAIIIFLSAYALTTQRAQLAIKHNQSLMKQLQEANLQLQSHSNTLKQLGVAKERQRLARELHDSVTQTVFSMTLTTQSALLLLERDPSRVGVQLERLNLLSQNALAEMHTLITELRPEKHAGGLVVELHQHVEKRQIPDGLCVTFKVEGNQSLSSSEDQGLVRITQEALNNVVKHTHATKVCLHLHLVQPCWIEIEDNGQGFNLEQAQRSGHLGIASMRERADEIDWNLSIQSIPGSGTHVRVDKKYPAEERL
jgi:signal transduction histidine kinase